MEPNEIKDQVEGAAAQAEAKVEQVATEVKDEAQQVAGAAEKAAKKAGKKKWPIVVGVVAVVLIAAGAGFWVWHEQPSFCAAICHTPMDAYYDTYNTGDYDKYGNALDSDDAKTSMMSYLHKENGANATCLSCHVPTLSEQVSEGLAWISGNYTVLGTNTNGQMILESKTLDDLTAARGVEGTEFCINDSCHKDLKDDDAFVEATANLSSSRNPHKFQHGDVDCTECHKAHTQSTNYCGSCHSDAPLPDGWVSYTESQKADANVA